MSHHLREYSLQPSRLYRWAEHTKLERLILWASPDPNNMDRSGVLDTNESFMFLGRGRVSDQYHTHLLGPRGPGYIIGLDASKDQFEEVV